MVAQINSLYIRTRAYKFFSRLISYACFEGRPLTTRGRWINPFIFTLFDIIKRMPQRKIVKKPLFIIGTGRSGTTILGIVMSMHRNVGYLNEPKALWHAIYSFEDLIGSYSRGDALYRLNESHVSEKIKRYAHRLYGAYLWIIGSERVMDKYPEMIFRAPFVKSIFPDAKFLFLVRNGWDTCVSISEWSKNKGKQFKGENHDWWGVDKRKWHYLVNQLVSRDPAFKSIFPEIRTFEEQTDMAAVEWIVTMREGLTLMKTMPDSIMMVRYEDLTCRPVQTLCNIFNFADLGMDRTCLNYGKHVLSPKSMRAPFDMHPSLRPIFDDTMRWLDYL